MLSLFKNKMVMLVLAGVVLAGVVWYSFLRDKGTASLLQTEDLTASNAVDSDIVQILLQLRAVSLSGTIFSDPVFMSLNDYGKDIIPEPVGRPNPFAPLPGSQQAAAAAASTTPSPSLQLAPPRR